MPRSRFSKLDADKQVRIMEVAAQEFAAQGYANASLNRILEQAAISKGAAYYYFDDKRDLFVTTVRYFMDDLGMGAAAEFGATDATSYWQLLHAYYAAPLLSAHAAPWKFAVVKAAADVPSDLLADTALEDVVAGIGSLLQSLVAHGQALGAIRTDLPPAFIEAVIRALDSASDQWLLAHWHELDPPAVAALVEQTVGMMRRALEP